MGAVRRLRPSGPGDGLNDHELETFQSESHASVPPPAPAAVFVIESVPAYPPRESHPTSSARLAPPLPGDVPVAVVRPRLMVSVRRTLRAVALAPFRVCAFALRAIGGAVYTVVAFAGRAVTRAAMAVVAAALAVVAFARAITGTIFGAAAGAARLCVGGVSALGRGVAAAFAFIGNRIVHAARAAVALVVTGVALASAAKASCARLASAPEWRGLVPRAPLVAAVLALAAVAAGGILQLSRPPVAQPVAAAARVELPPPVVAPVAAPVTPRPVTPRPEAAARPVPRRPTPKAAPAPRATATPRATDRAPARSTTRPEVEPPAASPLNADTVRAIWRATDTRSLERGLSAVRTATLALHRCNVRITSADRAVARCDGPRDAAWTIDFRRADERWLIDDISGAAQ